MKFHQIDARDLSNISSDPISKVRRNVNFFLPPDPLAKRRSGYKRVMNINDAYLVYLATRLISDLAYSYHEAKEILNDLRPWMESVNLFPMFNSKRTDLDIKVTDFSVRIIEDELKVNGSFYYQCVGRVKRRKTSAKSSYRSAFEIQCEKVEYDISQKHRIYNMAGKEYLTAKIFDINRFMLIFVIGYAEMIGDINFPRQWQKEWEKAVV